MSRCWRPGFNNLYTLQLALKIDLHLNNLIGKPLCFSACCIPTLHCQGSELQKQTDTKSSPFASYVVRRYSTLEEGKNLLKRGLYIEEWSLTVQLLRTTE